MSAYLRSLGLAYRPGKHEVECAECRGAGYFESDNGPSPRETDCEDCGGTGVVEADEDEECEA